VKTTVADVLGVVLMLTGLGLVAYPLVAGWSHDPWWAWGVITIVALTLIKLGHLIVIRNITSERTTP